MRTRIIPHTSAHPRVLSGVYDWDADKTNFHEHVVVAWRVSMDGNDGYGEVTPIGLEGVIEPFGEDCREDLIFVSPSGPAIVREHWHNFHVPYDSEEKAKQECIKSQQRYAEKINTEQKGI